VIRVYLQPEPVSFDDNVRQPGMAFLGRTAEPTSWKGREYWLHCLHDLYNSYSGICAYSAEWIPQTTGDPTVDHFVPKSANSRQTYEWPNFRLACLRFNRWKREFQDVLDPFEIQDDWFALDFPSLQIKPADRILVATQQRVRETITRLRLNTEICIRSRERWIKDFCTRQFTFEYLSANAPFIARELNRQGIVDTIPEIMNY